MDISTPRSNLVVRFLSVFLLCCTSLYASADQTGKQKITVIASDVTLETVFKQIEKQTGLRFMYAVDAVDVKEKVTVAFEKVMLDEVLGMLLGKKGIEWVYREGGISLKLKNSLADLPKASKSINAGAVPNTISGKVIDKDGNPIPGATVIIKGARKGTKTNHNGEFLLTGIEFNTVLVVSSIGFESKEVIVNNKNLLVRMNGIISSLDETVIRGGYYNTTQRFNTGNVTTIKAEDIAKQPVSDPLLTLQGRVPGMIITQTTGITGGQVKVQIRGQNSLNSGTQPLIIIDGIPYSGTINNPPVANFGATGNILSALSFINPSDIESIDVLKDADATAIYGSRGANGVILVNTKKAKAGMGMKIDVNMFSGWANNTRWRKLMNTNEYLKMRREAFNNDNVMPTADPTDIGYAPDLTIWDTTRYTDWQKELMGGTARYNDVQASISGGVNTIQYMVGGNYHKETTIFPGDFNVQNGSVHFALNGVSPDQSFRTSLTSTYVTKRSNFPDLDFAFYADLPPNAPPGYNVDGSLNWANSTWDNPYIKLISGIVEQQTNNLLNNVNISYRLLPGLVLQGNLGYNELRSNTFSGSTIAGVDPKDRNNARANATHSNIKNSSWIFEPQINYAIERETGTLNFLAGATLLGTKEIAQTMLVNGIISDALIKNISAGTSYTSYGSGSSYKYAAFFARGGYNFRGKYLLNLTWRRDGSSRFGPRRKFASFGAVGAAWIFSQEDLILSRLPFITYGKVRGSYGTTGNDQIGDYQYLDRYEFQQQEYQGVKGLQVFGLFNPDFGWELTRKTELALELGFLKDRILLNTSYYNNNSSNQLVRYTLPTMVGSSSVVGNLSAKIRNKGIEVVLTTKNIQGDKFNWSTSFNLSRNRNKLVSYGGNGYIYARVGGTLSEKYLFKSLGVDSETGQYIFQNYEGKPGPIEEAELGVTSVELAPSFFGGFQNSFQFKGFLLDVFFQYVKQTGINGINTAYMPGTRSNQLINVLDRWQKKGDVKNIQRFNQDYVLGQSYDGYLLSDKAYGDASFIRCKNLSLSWQIPEKWKKRMSVTNCRIYVQGQNLFTISKYPGLDPETQSFYSIPPLFIMTFGIHIVI